MLADAKYEPSRPIQLRAGDVLLAYSEGLMDDWGRDGSAPQNIQASLHRHAAEGEGALAILDGLLVDLDAHVQGGRRGELAAVVLRARDG